LKKILPQEAVFEDAADCAEAVFPADFFAFGIGAAVVGDGDFVDANKLGVSVHFLSKHIKTVFYMKKSPFIHWNSWALGKNERK